LLASSTARPGRECTFDLPRATHASRPLGGGGLRELHDRWASEERFRRTLEVAANLLARLKAPGRIRRENEFDLALAVADVAWRSNVADARATLGAGLECPACANTE
jgi:hypothetical protein